MKDLTLIRNIQSKILKDHFKLKEKKRMLCRIKFFKIKIRIKWSLHMKKFMGIQFFKLWKLWKHNQYENNMN